MKSKLSAGLHFCTVKQLEGQGQSQGLSAQATPSSLPLPVVLFQQSPISNVALGNTVILLNRPPGDGLYWVWGGVGKDQGQVPACIFLVPRFPADGGAFS